jgi:hypothetical protein
MDAHTQSEEKRKRPRRVVAMLRSENAAAVQRRRWPKRGMGAAALGGALGLLVLGTCSAFSPLGASAGLWQRSTAARLGGMAVSGRSKVRTRSHIGELQCALAVSPNSIYSTGDWGLLLPTAEQPKRPTLPRLTTNELNQLLAGERVQRQSRVGPVGHGLVVMDVNADIATVLAVLSDVQRYPQRIGTVREAAVYTGGSRNLCKARFKLSRFKLDVQVELYLSKARNMLEFRLDKTAGMQGAVFDEARGYWYLEPCPERAEGWTRVWLNARVQCSPLLPSGVIDYAATKALPRATTWLAPCCEAAARELNGASKDVHSVGLSVPLDLL